MCLRGMSVSLGCRCICGDRCESILVVPVFDGVLGLCRDLWG